MKEKFLIEKQELNELKKVSLGKRLKWVIKRLKLTAKEFSERCGISYRTLMQYLNDQRTPGANNLKPIAETFNINLHWLITGEGYPFVESEQVKDTAGKEETSPAESLSESLSEKEAGKEEKKVPKEELSFMFRCIEEVLALPEEERFKRLFEMVGEKYGISFLFHPSFGRGEGGKPRKVLETVKDVVEAYEEIDSFIRKAREKIPS